MVSRALLGLLILVGAFALPWWVVVPLVIAFLAQGGTPAVPITAGLIMDLTFGVGIQSLGGFSYLYTALFAFLSLVAWYLLKTLSE